MIIPIHHTEEIPMMNCGEGKIFTKTIDGGGWHCVTEEEYEIQRDISNTNAVYCIILCLVVCVVVFTVIHLVDKYCD